MPRTSMWGQVRRPKDIVSVARCFTTSSSPSAPPITKVRSPMPSSCQSLIFFAKVRLVISLPRSSSATIGGPDGQFFNSNAPSCCLRALAARFFFISTSRNSTGQVIRLLKCSTIDFSGSDRNLPTATIVIRMVIGCGPVSASC